MSTVYYRSRVVRLGEEVEDMLHAGTVIFFAEPVPEALECVSIIHHPELAMRRPLRPGDTVHLGALTFPIRAVGAIASQNVRELGHLVLYCDGATEPLLPGAVHTDQLELALEVGDIIELSGE